MRVFLIYLWRIWFVILGLLIGLPIFPFLYFFARDEKYSQQCYGLMRFWCICMFYGMGFRYQLIKQKEQKIEQKQQYIIIANHTSIIDVLLPCILFPDHFLCYVGKKELEKIPIFGTIFKRICVSVDRSDAQSRAEVYVKCAERMKQGKSIVIFPEGGVPDDTSIILDNFRNGAFSMAVQHQFPLVVFTFLGLKEMFPFDNRKGFPGKVKVVLNDILIPDKDMETLKKMSWNLIKETLDNNKIN